MLELWRHCPPPSESYLNLTLKYMSLVHFLIVGDNHSRHYSIITPPRYGSRSRVLWSVSVCVCATVCVCVCLSVCLSASISLELLDQSSRNLLCRSPVVVTRSSSGGVAIRYVLPILWMTLRLVVVGRMAMRD